jgi:hypothetical protein
VEGIQGCNAAAGVAIIGDLDGSVVRQRRDGIRAYDADNGVLWTDVLPANTDGVPTM